MRDKSKKHLLLLLAMCSLTMSGMGLPVMSNGVFILPIAEDLGTLHGNVAMHNTITMLMKALMSLYVPVLINKFSIKKVITAGVFITGLANYALGLSDQILLLNVLGAIRGMGAGLLAWVPITMIINEWFDKKHGIVTSIVLSFSSIGGAIFSPLFTNLITSMGWQFTYRVMGILIILFGLPAVLLKYTLEPQASGFLPYGFKDKSKDTKTHLVESVTQNNLRKLAITTFIFLLIFGLLQTMLTGIPQHFPGFVQSIDFSVTFGATLISIAMIGSIGYKLLLGLISDYIGPVKATITMLMLIGFGSVLLLWAKNLPHLFIGAFLFGAVYTMPTVAVTLLSRYFFGRQLFQKYFPTLSFATSIGGALSISVIGFIYDFTDSYDLAFIFSLVVVIMNTGGLMYLNRAKKTE